ncbi:MAG: hypothetical protein Q7R62_01975 [bacterium]|nr:hypothetical protein [bacterium]
MIRSLIVLVVGAIVFSAGVAGLMSSDVVMGAFGVAIGVVAILGGLACVFAGRTADDEACRPVDTPK